MKSLIITRQVGDTSTTDRLHPMELQVALDSANNEGIPKVEDEFLGEYPSCAMYRCMNVSDRRPYVHYDSFEDRNRSVKVYRFYAVWKVMCPDRLYKKIKADNPTERYGLGNTYFMRVQS